MNDVCITTINKSDFSENVDYNVKEYPAYIRKGTLSHYPNYSAVSHWHEDLEFIVILSGHMLYNINGTVVDLKEGDGIMVNSRQFHHGYSDDFTECEFICILLHPLLLCINEYFQNTYADPIITNMEQPWLLLLQDIPWQNQILNILRNIYEQNQNNHTLLEIQQSVFTLWIPLYQNFPRQKSKAVRPNRQLTAVKQMLSFIQEHYKETLSLEMIADSGNVCKSSCAALFRKYLCQTPISYLTGYRLDKSLDLLLNSDMSITEISYEVGFNNASYFAETFRKYYHCAPREYVRNKQ